MAKELERKFKVNPPKPELTKIIRNSECSLINQGYLADSKGAMVRVRTMGEDGFLTIKCSDEGYDAFEVDEYEYKIPLEDAKELLVRCEHKLQKFRYKVDNNGDIWDLDVYTEALTGLITAEFEHTDRDKVLSVDIPWWVDEEVTGDSKFSNFSLAKANE